MRNSIKMLSLSSSIQDVGKRVVENFSKKHPKIYKTFSILKYGIARFFRETYTFGKIKYKLSSTDKESASKLTWKEIEIYRQIPRDWKKVGPTIVISSFPLLQYIILPIAYLYPQKLLCHQFWTIGQKLKFNEDNLLKKRRLLHKPILNHLVIQADTRLNDRVAKKELVDFIQRFENDNVDSLDEVLSISKIFNRKEFNLDKLEFDHRIKLAKLNECLGLFYINNINNLNDYAFWLREQDKRLLSEDLISLEPEYLFSLGFERGINSKAFSNENLLNNLKLWLEYSHKLNSYGTNANKNANNTLFLHSKIFLRNVYSKNSKQ